MDKEEEKIIQKINKRLENKKIVQLNDPYRTMIYIDKDADEKKAIIKYYKDWARGFSNG